jgi:hypothetical protein
MLSLTRTSGSLCTFIAYRGFESHPVRSGATPFLDRVLRELERPGLRATCPGSRERPREGPRRATHASSQLVAPPFITDTRLCLPMRPMTTAPIVPGPFPLALPWGPQLRTGVSTGDTDLLATANFPHRGDRLLRQSGENRCGAVGAVPIDGGCWRSALEIHDF